MAFAHRTMLSLVRATSRSSALLSLPGARPSASRILVSVRPMSQEVPSPAPSTKNKERHETSHLEDMVLMVKPSPFERWILSKSGEGAFKNVDDIPEKVERSAMERAKSIFRMKAATFIMIGCLAICALIVAMDKSSQVPIDERALRKHEVYSPKEK
ncbi:hypothetical protein TCAL_10931 [Tigriopus californicus]|uniref:Uncharacterized protein n=1 Tax=Tigriopus californicus TaxID=6832 RepID=A0A553PHM1_TIGCA|nr:uncharacterized protein LOC131880868 [Tigriopus californicus]TRY77178.1 hypothetical protein TCAL_10931 [Tigriopus californicus]|eukprot:TCALIF_10931-PA protein Name:"Protein of unknown function" AED:0.00 eAED:0.00 QI:399/1/1/1/0.33/0.5/4/239/156